MIIIDPSIDPKDLYRLIRSGDVSMEDFEFYIQDIHEIAHTDGISEVVYALAKRQRPLDPDFSKILNDNLEDLIHEKGDGC